MLSLPHKNEDKKERHTVHAISGVINSTSRF